MRVLFYLPTCTGINHKLGGACLIHVTPGTVPGISTITKKLTHETGTRLKSIWRGFQRMINKT